MSADRTNSGNILATTLFFAIPIVYFTLKVQEVRKRQLKHEQTKSISGSYDTSLLNCMIRPPFPPAIRDMLSRARLAYLSTVEGESSHLSLMRFSYINDDIDGEVVIMTTRRETKKFDMLQKQNGVALLVHDFPQFENDKFTGVHSITLNGRCIILDDGGEKAEKYRAEHLKQNPDYPQFIVGSNISVLCVIITSASICNINDQVEKWSAQDSSSQ
mmetsp:Transcript_18302/g.22408  ORF Transcript_18302/g.22408 Transcript_18302/m.22408 type:complete len:216 (+) Transcript_18302:60-707(+)